MPGFSLSRGRERPRCSTLPPTIRVHAGVLAARNVAVAGVRDTDVHPRRGTVTVRLVPRSSRRAGRDSGESAVQGGARHVESDGVLDELHLALLERDDLLRHPPPGTRWYRAPRPAIADGLGEQSALLDVATVVCRAFFLPATTTQNSRVAAAGFTFTHTSCLESLPRKTELLHPAPHGEGGPGTPGGVATALFAVTRV